MMRRHVVVCVVDEAFFLVSCPRTARPAHEDEDGRHHDASSLRAEMR